MKVSLTLLTIILLTINTNAQKAVNYILSMPQPHTHYFEVEMLIKDINAKTLDVKMPVWAPGSFLVREFARNVEDFISASPDGKIIPNQKLTKNCWRINTGGQKEISIKYKV